MVEPVDGLSPGVLGFRLSGKVTRDESQDELMRPIYAALERGEQLNLYFEFADDFSGLDAGALWRTSRRLARSVSSTARPGGGWRS